MFDWTGQGRSGRSLLGRALYKASDGAVTRAAQDAVFVEALGVDGG